MLTTSVSVIILSALWSAPLQFARVTRKFKVHESGETAATEQDYTTNNPAPPQTLNLGSEKRQRCDNPKWNGGEKNIFLACFFNLNCTDSVKLQAFKVAALTKSISVNNTFWKFWWNRVVVTNGGKIADWGEPCRYFQIEPMQTVACLTNNSLCQRQRGGVGVWGGGGGTRREGERDDCVLPTSVSCVI